MVRSLQEDSARWQREKDRNYKQGVSGSLFNLQPYLAASQLTDVSAYEHSNSRTYHQDQTPMQVPMSIPMQSHSSQMAPQVTPTHEKSDPGRYVYDSQGNPYYDLKYKKYLTQPPAAVRSEETPRVYPTEPPATGWSVDSASGKQYSEPPSYPASAPTTGYWTIDPTSGKQYYVVNGRAQWAP